MNRSLNAELEAKRTDLVALCRKYGVTRLDVFGSGATADWRPHGSDLDFLVEFRPEPGPGLADRYLGLAEALEALFGRPIDLLTEGAIHNPYFRRSVNATRAPVYVE